MLHYISPSGKFSLEYPDDFFVKESDGITLVEASNRKSCLTISSHVFDQQLPASMFITLFQKLTAHYEEIQQPLYENEKLLFQRFKTVKPNNNGDVVTTFWSVCMKRLLQEVVVITINVDSREDINVYERYEKVLVSILESSLMST